MYQHKETTYKNTKGNRIFISKDSWYVSERTSGIWHQGTLIVDGKVVSDDFGIFEKQLNHQFRVIED